MSEILGTLREILKRQLTEAHLEVIGIMPISQQSDPMIKTRTLEELLEEFEPSDHRGAHQFILQVRKTPSQPASKEPIPQHTSPEENSSIYNSEGQLNVEFLSHNARLLFAAKEYPLARNIYQAILDSGQRDGEVHFALGQCYEYEGSFDKALSHYKEAVAFTPSFDHHQRLASLLIKTEKDLQAAEVLERATMLKGLSSAQRFEILQACGNCWTRGSRPEEAERAYKRALEIKPQADEIRANLGALALQMGQVQEARRHFQDAIASNTRNFTALTGLGECELRENHKRTAHDYFIQSLEIELNQPNTLSQLVKCAYELKSYTSAAHFLKEYTLIAVVSPQVLYSLAGLQFHLGRLDEAKATASKTLEIQPNHPGALELLELIKKYQLTPT